MRNVFLIVNKIITKQSAIVKILQCEKQQTVPGLCGVPWGPKLVGAMFLYNAISKSSIFQKKSWKIDQWSAQTVEDRRVTRILG